MSSTKIKKVTLAECASLEGLVVVIDVLRAFTTAAYAFAAGAEEIWLVGEIEEAFCLHREHPDTLLMGERQGVAIPGFHFDNSPVQFTSQTLKGKKLIQTTSSGTQGVVRSRQADKLLVSSFVVAEATYSYIVAMQARQVNFVITGSCDGSEDVALADYLEAKLAQGTVDACPYLEKVRDTLKGPHYSSKIIPGIEKDIEAACQIDRFPFAMEVFRERGINRLRQLAFP